MYELKQMLGKVVTIRTNKGEEIIAEMLGLNELNTIMTVANPRVVVYSNNEVVILPFALTANTEVVHLQISNMLTTMPSLEDSAAVYKQIVKEDQPQEVEVEVDDA